ncbi:arrestin domain-containing protein 1 isoform X2 [Eurytemora carolleeae]|uniref:arrestin domain-containing protein 1 isoform X2 n=1 Tax=Eurytemora carolleeae TaxID=1294199 RepID=UPI000C764F37|nr:arrestin domain-containing protein 1 isoform X2 [Eurytemora carolleeae]XP_023343517.1 arrestin domain-containing protein 1 isoform X2 [Eurytemora carolleeae]|eukprot:XP_023343516.1 arrestin domain-containing protein 1-like isoform X2 [Eurytemora affinis]
MVNQKQKQFIEGLMRVILRWIPFSSMDQSWVLDFMCFRSTYSFLLTFLHHLKDSMEASDIMFRVKKHFTLNSIVDLNMYQGCNHPGESRDSKTFCCLCCRSGPLCALIMTDRSGYVPGESIIFTAEVDNQSSKEMTNSTVQLVEKVTFKAGGHTRSTSRIIAEQQRGRIGPGDSDLWNKVAMYVPGLPPSNLGGSCNIIQLQYILQLVVHPSGVGFALTVSLPITIGTIPLQEYMNQFSYNSGIGTAPPPPPAIYNSDPTQNQPGAIRFYAPGSDINAPPPYPPVGYNPSAYPPSASAPPGAYPPGASAPPLPTSFSAYSNLPPPSYASSVWGEVNVKADDDDEHTRGDFKFVPQYPTYNVIKPY